MLKIQVSWISFLRSASFQYKLADILLVIPGLRKAGL